MRFSNGSFTKISLSALATTLAVSCGGGDGNGGPTGPSQPAPAPSSVAITTGANLPPRFIPTNITVAAGGKVKWTNGSPGHHNLVATSANWQLNEDLPVGGSFETTIAKAGTYRYQCTVHSGMAGTVVVK